MIKYGASRDGKEKRARFERCIEGWIGAFPVRQRGLRAR